MRSKRECHVVSEQQLGSTECQQARPNEGDVTQADSAQRSRFPSSPESARSRRHPLLIRRTVVRIHPGASRECLRDGGSTSSIRVELLRNRPERACTSSPRVGGSNPPKRVAESARGCRGAFSGGKVFAGAAVVAARSDELAPFGGGQVPVRHLAGAPRPRGEIDVPEPHGPVRARRGEHRRVVAERPVPRRAGCGP